MHSTKHPESSPKMFSQSAARHYANIGRTIVDKMRTYNEMFSAFGCKKNRCKYPYVVLSMSRPQPDSSTDLRHRNNTSQEESQESEGGLNEHWRKTLMTVQSLLYPFISNIKDKSNEELYDLFFHVRTAKCCSNADGGSNEEKNGLDPFRRVPS